MPARSRRGAACLLAGALAGAPVALPLAAGPAGAPVAPASGLYRINSSYSMPHLEEALRASALSEERCVAAGDAAAFFPLLRQAPLQGCTLAGAARSADSLGYWLRCEQPGGPSGTARIGLDTDHTLSGVLDVKMGGKNMTLTQRMTALRLGPCD